MTELTELGFRLKYRKMIWGDYFPGGALETHTQGLFLFRLTSIH